jgi:hypothetical protein
MGLYASYVCLLHSHFIENHSIVLEVTNSSFLRWFCHTQTLLCHVALVVPTTHTREGYIHGGGSQLRLRMMQDMFLHHRSK